MAGYVTSIDGTRIAFDRFGSGPPVIIVAGLLCDRDSHHELAERLASQFETITYDRRGRGDSGDTLPYAVEREIEDLAALIDEVGGSAMAYGHSSGAGLAMNAAAAGVTITRLVLHEPPYGAGDEESQREARKLAETIREGIAEDRRADAISTFMAAAGVPDEVAAGMAADARMLELAPTMPYDHEVMGDYTRGGTIPRGLVRSVEIPSLVLAGSASPDFFRDTAERIAGLLPNGTFMLLERHDHGAPAEAVAPVIAEFFGG